MSTRARIIYSFKNYSNKREIVSIYNHSDGYPSGLGRMLRDYYGTAEKVACLIALGDISYIGAAPVDCAELWNFSSPTYDALMSVPDCPFCRTYKGRGEKDVDAKKSESVKECIKTLGQEWNYLFEDGAWYVVEIENGKVKKTGIDKVIKRDEAV